MLSMFIDQDSKAIPIYFITKKNYANWLEEQSHTVKTWLRSTGFECEPGTIGFLPSSLGEIEKVIWIEDDSFWQYAALAQKLPAGSYKLSQSFDSVKANHACLAWGLAFYSFDKYSNKSSDVVKKLVWPQGVNVAWIKAHLEAIFYVRDWINTPAVDLTPDTLASIAQALANEHKAEIQVVRGLQLRQDYPAVYAVGKAAAVDPCYIHIRHIHPQAVKKIALVGKGVCFDTGGLDLKLSGNMLLMKKDMGGAAHALALAHLIMSLNVKVQLDVYIPVVENSIGSKALRPSDVIKTRKGLTVEIGNTDAEGRLILADALDEATQGLPDLIIDYATLTGAARISLGTELPALFTNNQMLTNKFIAAAERVNDPVWQMPLFKPYVKQLKSTIADLSNVGKNSYAGAIIAALFLEKFVEPEVPWIHIDLMAYNVSSSPGKPEGGEAMALRGAFEFIQSWVLEEI